MSFYKTLEEILTSNTRSLSNTSSRPWREFSLPGNNFSLADIKTWELVYSVPEVITLWAAWNPYTEYYLIVHELFKSEKWGIEEYTGSNAENLVIKRFQSFGVDLPISKIWLEKEHVWMKESSMPH